MDLWWFMYTQSALVPEAKIQLNPSEPRRNGSPEGSASFGFCCRLLAESARHPGKSRDSHGTWTNLPRLSIVMDAILVGGWRFRELKQLNQLKPLNPWRFIPGWISALELIQSLWFPGKSPLSLPCRRLFVCLKCKMDAQQDAEENSAKHLAVSYYIH